MDVHVEVDDGVATVTYARPEGRGSFDVEAVRHLRERVETTLDRGDVRALVLTGEGDVFCTGADVKAFAADLEGAPATIHALTSELHPLLQRLHEGPVPVVTAVNGVVAGGGFGLALAGDVRVAAETARFRASYFRIGLCPDGGVTYFLTRYAGFAAAQRILLLDPLVDAVEARALGLVHAVVPPEDLLAEARVLARELAAWAPRSVGETKRLLASAGTADAAGQMAAEAAAIGDLGATADFQEGIGAFVEKRPPRFGDR